MINYLIRGLGVLFLLLMIGACDRGQAVEDTEPALAEQPAATAAPETGDAEPASEPAAAPAAETGAAVAAAADTPPPSPRDEVDQEALLEQMVHDIWWNAPVIASALDLTSAQQEAMNNYLRDYVQATQGRMEQTPELMNTYREALSARNWDQADALAQQMSQMAATSMNSNFMLQTSVLRELDEEQFTRAVEKYPGVLARQWVRGRRVMGADQISRGMAGGQSMQRGDARMRMHGGRDEQRQQRQRDKDNGASG